MLTDGSRWGGEFGLSGSTDSTGTGHSNSATAAGIRAQGIVRPATLRINGTSLPFLGTSIVRAWLPPTAAHYLPLHYLPARYLPFALPPCPLGTSQVRDDGVWEEHRRTPQQRSEFALQSSKGQRRAGGAAPPPPSSRGNFGLATGSPFTLEGTAVHRHVISVGMCVNSWICTTIPGSET